MTQAQYRNRVLLSVIDETIPVLDRAIESLEGLQRGRNASRRLRRIRHNIAMLKHCYRGGIR